MSTKPFQKDISELKVWCSHIFQRFTHPLDFLQKISKQLNNEKLRQSDKSVELLTGEVLSYVTERNTLWLKQNANLDTGKLDALEFSGNHLPHLK